MLPMLHTRAPGSPSLNDTFGALLIGTYVGVIIYGLNLYQTARYFKAFPHDHLYLKVLVAVVLVLETWHTVLCMHMCYHYLVTNYFNPAALLEGCVPINLSCIAAGLSIIACQTFFVRRVYILVGWRWRIIVALVVTFLLAELGLAMAIMVETFLKPAFAQFEQVTWIVSVAFGFSAIADIILTTVLICALRRCRTGIKRYGIQSLAARQRTAGRIVVDLIIYAISTGLLTGIFDFLTFIFALVRPKDLIFFGLDIVAVKLYPTSLLTALNSRRMLAKQSSDAAAIYGDSGILVSESDLGRRPVLALSRRLGLRDLTRHETNGAEAIEMNVKANHCAGEVRLQPSVIEIGPLESGTTHSQAETA